MDKGVRSADVRRVVQGTAPPIRSIEPIAVKAEKGVRK